MWQQSQTRLRTRSGVTWQAHPHPAYIPRVPGKEPMGEFKVGDKIRVNLHPRQNRGRHRLRRDSGRRWNQTTGGYREWIVHTLWSTTARTTQTKVQATRL